MDDDGRNFPPSEWEARIEAANRRMKEGLPPVPWLPRGLDLIGLRRQIRRARAGIIKPGNPNISAQAWADTLEQGLVLNQLEIRQVRQEIDEEHEREAALQQNTLEYNRYWMDAYRAFKRLPEAADPASEVAVQIESMKRELRRLRGRRKRWTTPDSSGSGLK
jgi:hypothetical protein